MATEKVKEPPLRFHLRMVRLAFPNLQTDGKFGYGARFLLDPNHTQTLNPGSRKFCEALGIKLPADPKAVIKTVPLFKQIALGVARAKWGAKGDAIFKALDGQDKLFWHDGDTKAEWEGFEGNVFVAAGAKGPITLFDAQRNEIGEKEAYSGSWGIASIDVWAQDNSEGGKRINATVYGWQKLKDDDAFSSGGTPSDAEEFDEELGVESEEPTTDDDTDLTA